MKSPRDLDDVYNTLGMARPDAKEIEAKAKAKAAEVAAMIEEQTERLTKALAREAIALPHLESLEPKLSEGKEALALAQQAVDATSSAISAAMNDRRKHETQVADAEQELEQMKQKLALLSGERSATAADGEFEGTGKEADTLKKMDRKQARPPATTHSHHRPFGALGPTRAAFAPAPPIMCAPDRADHVRTLPSRSSTRCGSCSSRRTSCGV